MLGKTRFRRLLGTGLTVGGIGMAAAVGFVIQHARTEHAKAQWTELKAYCTDCHNSAEAAGDIVFEGVSAEAVPRKPATFEKAVRKLRGRLMPPPGNPQPDQKLVDGFVAWAEHAIDTEATEPRAGHVPVQRLNRTEYAASVRALLDVDINAADYLPNEIEVDGFDNIAAALSVSPAFLEQYISIARRVAHLAVGATSPKLESAYFPPPDGDQDGYTDGMPLGTRGGTRFEHDFPADGDYKITITDLDVGLYPRSIETRHTLVILLDRKEVFRGELGGKADLALVDHGGAPARAEIMKRFADMPVPIKAGVHEIVVTFVERSRAATDEEIYGFTPYGGFSFTGQMRAPRVIGGIQVVGPFDATGVSHTASRDKVFVCQPETAGDERACAERITANLARRAFRRPVTQDDVDRLMPFYDAGRAGPGSFDAGIEQVVAAVLASPDFLYRAIALPKTRPTAGRIRSPISSSHHDSPSSYGARDPTKSCSPRRRTATCTTPTS